ncbi:MAG: rod shape-determining protein RodA [Acidimicrobiia bacterium]|nr:rod shape-determining protein RodA [Acidimicrobiia bacterium]
MTTSVFPRTDTTPRSRDLSSPWLHVDVSLIVAVVAMAGLGVLMVYSATRGPGGPENPVDRTFLERQALFVAIGFAAMAVTALVDYRRIRDFAGPIYVATLVLLVVVLSPLGTESKGVQAWFQLGPFQLQPSEIAKIGVILALAAMVASKGPELRLVDLFRALALTGIPMGLIMLQPDLGTVLVFVAITMGVLLVGGARPRHIIVVTLIGVVGVVGILNSDMLADYQKARLTAFLDPQADVQGETYNVDQAQITVGAGGLTGAGLFNGRQTRSEAVPEQQTDFIFTVVGEELGFIGGAGVLALFGFVIWRIWRAAQLSRDTFGTLLRVGVLSMLLFQIFQNVGMATGIMPITGIPLPFLSYGGSSIVTAFIGIGLVLNVHMRRFS